MIIEKAAIIALGSNLVLEDTSSIATLESAIRELQALSSRPLITSSIWQTDPLDCPPGSPVFMNAIVALDVATNTDPEVLLQRLQRIETRFGRYKSEILNAPRVLDLDFISFAGKAVQTVSLVLPHPRAHLRRFVLQPLCEIAPRLVLPGQENSVSELLLGLKSQGNLIKIELSN